MVISAVAMYDDVRQLGQGERRGRRRGVPRRPGARAPRARPGDEADLRSDRSRDGATTTSPRLPTSSSATTATCRRRSRPSGSSAFVRAAPLRADVDHGRPEHWQTFYASAATRGAVELRAAVAGELAPGRLLESAAGTAGSVSSSRRAGFEVTRPRRIQRGDRELPRALRRSAASPSWQATSRAWTSEAGSFDAVYSRFCLHAMTPAEEDSFVGLGVQPARAGGSLFLECRSIKDPLARQGEVHQQDRAHSRPLQEVHRRRGADREAP